MYSEDIDFFTYFDDSKHGFALLKWWPSNNGKTWTFNEMRDGEYSGLGNDYFDFGNEEKYTSNLINFQTGSVKRDFVSLE